MLAGSLRRHVEWLVRARRPRRVGFLHGVAHDDGRYRRVRRRTRPHDVVAALGRQPLVGLAGPRRRLRLEPRRLHRRGLGRWGHDEGLAPPRPRSRRALRANSGHGSRAGERSLSGRARSNGRSVRPSNAASSTTFPALASRWPGWAATAMRGGRQEALATGEGVVPARALAVRRELEVALEQRAGNVGGHGSARSSPTSTSASCT